MAITYPFDTASTKALNGMLYSFLQKAIRKTGVTDTFIATRNSSGYITAA